MKKNVVYILLLLFVLTSGVKPSVKVSETKASRVGRTNGYLMGQQFVIDLMKRKFPDLKSNIVLAELEFKNKFGEAKSNLDSFTLSVFGDSAYKVLKKGYSKEILNNFDTVNFDREAAILFIDEIKKRAKGEMVTPILETLLHFEYLKNPASEILNGYTSKYDFTSNTKANGTSWTMRLPKSWGVFESDRPHVIKRFVNDYGDGEQIILPMVIGDENDEKYTKEEISKYFSEVQMKKVIPQGSKFLSFQKMSLNGDQGCCIIYEIESEQLGTKIYMKQACYYFYHNNQFIVIQYGYGTTSKKLFSENNWNKGIALSKLVVNSIVFLK